MPAPRSDFGALFSICLLTALVALSATMFAQSAPDRTQFGHDVNVGPGETVTEVTCFACSVYVRGRVTSDVTVMGGHVVVEEGGEIKGDTTVLVGGVRLDDGARVGGDLTVFGGGVRREGTSSVAGDITDFNSAIWLILIFGLPLAIIGGVIALLVLLVRRLLRPAYAAA
jgi:hypothetical protein